MSPFSKSLLSLTRGGIRTEALLVARGNRKPRPTPGGNLCSTESVNLIPTYRGVFGYRLTSETSAWSTAFARWASTDCHGLKFMAGGGDSKLAQDD